MTARSSADRALGPHPVSLQSIMGMNLCRRLGRMMVGLTCLLIVGCEAETIDWSRLDTPVPAPDFVLSQLDAETEVRLSDLRGRIVVMEFWATWCGPCRFSTPSLDVMYRRYRDRGVTVLLINEGETAETIRTWVAERFEAPILMDSEQRVARRYRIRGIPQLYIVDQEGQIVYAQSGYRGRLEHNLELIFEELLTTEDVAIHG